MLLARAARFVTLAQRLEKQMQWLGMTEEEGEAKGRGLARAALCVRELSEFQRREGRQREERAKRRNHVLMQRVISGTLGDA